MACKNGVCGPRSSRPSPQIAAMNDARLMFEWLLWAWWGKPSTLKTLARVRLRGRVRNTRSVVD